MRKEEFEKQILENKPTAKITKNGDIELQVGDKFYQIIDNYCNESKAEVKKRTFQVAMLTALGLSASFIITSLNKDLINQVIISANAFLISSSIYINIAKLKRKEAENYKKNLKTAFEDEAKERFANNLYDSIEEDGTINFDSERGKKR